MTPNFPIFNRNVETREPRWTSLETNKKSARFFNAVDTILMTAVGTFLSGRKEDFRLLISPNKVFQKTNILRGLQAAFQLRIAEQQGIGCN
jgi:hypothetical protein